MRKLRNTSGLAPLTPDFSGSKCGTSFHPAHDLHTEEILWLLYQREKQRAERYLRERNEARDQLASKRKWARVKRLTQLKPRESK